MLNSDKFKVGLRLVLKELTFLLFAYFLALSLLIMYKNIHFR